MFNVPSPPHWTGIVLYFSVVLVVFVIVVGAALVYYRKWRGRNRKSPESSGPELHLDNITAGQVRELLRFLFSLSSVSLSSFLSFSQNHKLEHVVSLAHFSRLIVGMKI